MKGSVYNYHLIVHFFLSHLLYYRHHLSHAVMVKVG